MAPVATIQAAFDRVFGTQVSPTAQIRFWAAELLRCNGNPPPPIDVVLLAASVGVPVRRDDISCDGLLRKLPRGRYEIVLPKRRGPVGSSVKRRERFTVAHELGHFTLAHNLGVEPTADRGVSHDRLEETLCNIFAEHVIMPPDHIGRDLHLTGLRPARLLDLADAYQVSLRALLARVRYAYRDRKLVAVIWTRGSNGLRTAWTAPSTHRGLAPSFKALSTAERSRITREEEEGFDTFWLDAQRTRLWCVSFAYTPNDVLTLALPQRHSEVLRPILSRHQPAQPLQLSLFADQGQHRRQ
jgi:hypothetical protein